MGSRVGLITSDHIKDIWPDDELPVLISALRDRDVDAVVARWHVPSDMEDVDIAIIRSPSDFYWRQAEFLEWLADMETHVPLFNSPDVIRWCMDKRYLLDLSAHGVPVAPTHVCLPGDEPQFPDREFVVKPATSGGALNAARYRMDQRGEAREHVSALHDEGDVILVQPYLVSIDDVGERSLLFFDGAFSHAVRRGAVLKRDESFRSPREAFPDIERYVPTAEELALAKQALEVVPSSQPLLQARVDIAYDGDMPIVMELELVDPWLFLAQEMRAADRFALAVQSLVVDDI